MSRMFSSGACAFQPGLEQVEDGTSRGRELRVLWCFWVMFSSGAAAFEPGLEQVSRMFSSGASAFSTRT